MIRIDISFKLIIVLFSCLFHVTKAFNSGIRSQLGASRILRSRIKVKSDNKILRYSVPSCLRMNRLQCKESDDQDDNESKSTAEEEEVVGDKEDSSSGEDKEASGDNEEESGSTEGNKEEDNGDKEEELSPEAKAIKEAEETLRKQLNDLESTLRSERVNLSKIKDKKDMSGKNGFYIIQAQVNEWNKQKDAQQKKRIKANKREFVLKMLPTVDAFKQVASDLPPTNEREENMHESLGKIQYDQILRAFEKFGYCEFSAEKKEPIDPIKHQVEGDLVEQGTDYEGKVVEVLKKGVIDVDGNVIRRCLIVGGKPTAEREAAMKKAEEEAKAAEKLEDEEAEKLLEEEKEVEASVDEAEEDEDKDDSDANGSASK